jgi:hypothetical protein
MKQKLGYIAILAVAATLSISAQVRTGTPEKKEPDSRRVELPVSPGPQTPAQQNPLLPKIDLPEYVITGVASFSLSDVNKEEVEGRSLAVDVVQYRSSAGPRERNTVEFESHQKESLSSNSLVQKGQVRASVGNYFTPRVNFWFGQLEKDYDYRVEAGYRRTKGFAANTDQSGGNIGLRGGIAFTSGALQGGRLVGDAGWGTESYRFYGSTNPTAERKHSNSQFGLSVLGSPQGDFQWKANLGYRFDTIGDNAVETNQSRVVFGATSEYPVLGTPIQARVSYQSATLSGANNGMTSLFNGSLGTSRIWWNGFFAQVSGQFYSAVAMGNQSLIRLYPELTLGFQINANHRGTVSYGGSVSYLDLAGALQNAPYLGTNTQIRNADRQHRGSIVVESDWSTMVRTTTSVSYERVYDLALLEDPAGIGFTQLQYGGATDLWNFKTESFAMLTPNDYVTATLSINATKNSMTQLSVPYLPDFELVGSYTHRFPVGIALVPNFRYNHTREVGFLASQQLPGYLLLGLQAEYEPISTLRLIVEIDNMLDKRYEVWKGYQGAPFLVSGGLSFRW